MKPLLPDTYIGARILLIVMAIAGWSTYVVNLHAIYWNSNGLSGRKGARLRRERRGVVLRAVCLATMLVTTFLALFFNPIAAGFIAVVAFLIILVVFSAYGHGEDDVEASSHPHAHRGEPTKPK